MIDSYDYKSSDQKPEMEVLMCTVYGQVLRVSFIKHKINQSAESNNCRMCNENGKNSVTYFKQIDLEENSREGITMLPAWSTENYVTSLDWKEQEYGMGTSQKV